MGVDHQYEDVSLSGPVLKPWETGPAVIELQELLRAHGFSVKVDGNFDWVTEAAVKDFQRQHGFRIDGVVGPSTWAALKATVKSGTRVLRHGHSGQDVREVQGLLLIHGYDLKRDGIFGDRTRAAVQAFQKQTRLKETGMVDPVTLHLLRGGSSLPPLPRQSKWFFNNRRWW
jgi:peptidoglycan hydrolase-like protein with peptidoglycan-binding domain